jgi:hypothetical protein
MHQTRRLPAWHTKYGGQLRNSFPQLQYSVAHHSVPERRKTLRRGKGLTSECQMWRGLRSSIAGKVANNHFKYLGVLTSHAISVANPNGVDCTSTGNPPHQAPVLFNRTNTTVSMPLMLGSVVFIISREMPVPNMTVSGITLLLSLNPPSNLNKRNTILNKRKTILSVRHRICIRQCIGQQ